MGKNSRSIGGRVSRSLLREARIRERDARWLSSASAQLLQRYRGKYVAVKDRMILASSPTMKGLYSRLDKLDPGMVLITRIEKPTLVVQDIVDSFKDGLGSFSQTS